MNATLVVINSDGEQEYIRRYRNCDYWIGLHCTTEGTWRWVDGSDYTVNVKFWAIDQHNGTAGDCAVVSDGGLWQYRPFSSEHFPICEQPAP
ncbi:asialoglycoprotein receptor 2-like [Rhinoraja longicauda]